MSTYLWDRAWEQERERLLAWEDLFDGSSERRLEDLGVSEGWRCLEVGCGAGRVARWLAARVGDSGHVVATDLDLRFVGDERPKNLELRTHDIVADNLEKDAFDLAHARAVLQYVPEWRHALARMVTAVRPGGWVIVEEVDLGGAMTTALARYAYPSEDAELSERMLRGFDALFSAIGADPGMGPRLPGALHEAGLEHVAAEVHAPFVWGGAARDFRRLSLAHMRTSLVNAGLATDSDVGRAIDLTSQPSAGGVPMLMTTAWGQRPAR